MTDHRAPQAGAADSSAPCAGLADAQPTQQSARARAPGDRALSPPRAPGFAPAFGTGAGAAVVFRDFASI